MSDDAARPLSSLRTYTQIMDEMINEAAEMMRASASQVGGSLISRLASSVKSSAKL